MSNLRRVKLQDLCDRITVGHVGPMASEYTATGVPFLRSQNIDPFCLNLAELKFISPEFHAKLRKSALNPGDVVVVRTGFPGTACVIPESFTELNCADLVIITPSRELNPHYLAATFNSTWGRATVGGTLVGVAQQHFNVGAARNFELLVPPRRAQDRIADILFRYDELITNNRGRIEVLEKMARTLYRGWFVDVRPRGQKRLRQASVDTIPTDWHEANLDEIAECIRRNVPKGELDATIPYVGLEHIPRRSLALDAWETVQCLGSNKLLFKKGEILFGKIRPYFHKVSVAPFEGVCSADTLVIKAKAPEYRALVTAIVSSDDFVACASSSANGSKMPRAEWNAIKRYPIAIPPPGLNKKVSVLFESIIEHQQLLVVQIKNLRKTRDLLLPRFLSGQIDLDASNA